MRAVVDLDLPMALDRASAAPLQRQLADALRSAALDGRLAPGARLPSTRGLAVQLRLSRSTVIAVYEQLDGEGYLHSAHGSGTFVNPALAPPAPRAPALRAHAAATHAPVVDLRPGRPDTTRLVDPAWRAAWRAVGAAPVPAREPEVQGLEGLRVQIAEHLRLARGIAAHPDDVFVTAGTSEALTLSVHALGLAGRVVAVEDPGYPNARRVLTRLGCALRAVPIDDGGLIIERLPGAADRLGAVMVTPSHQYPLGAALRIERRQALLHHVRTHRAVVIEDDYDSEFRYGAPPLPALAALGPDLVVHVGTFSKTITPWLRLGFLLAPPHARAAFQQARADLGCPVSGIDQQAMASYMATGALRRHIARARRDYRHRRAHLHRLLTARPQLTSTDTAAGLHAVIRLPSATVVPDLLADLLTRGIRVADLAEYPLDAAPAYPGLVLGFGDATTSDLTHAITTLHDLLTPTPHRATAPTRGQHGPPAHETA